MGIDSDGTLCAADLGNGVSIVFGGEILDMVCFGNFGIDVLGTLIIVGEGILVTGIELAIEYCGISRTLTAESILIDAESHPLFFGASISAL